MNSQPPHQHHNHTAQHPSPAPQDPPPPSASPAPPLIFVNTTDPESIARASLSPSSTPSLPHRPAPSKDDIANSLRREDYKAKRHQNTLWLDNAWGGSTWLPHDLRDGVAFQPAAGVLTALIDITKWARQNSVQLDSLWRQGGPLREAVSRDFEERQRVRKPRSRPLKPYLSVPVAKGVLSSLRQSTATATYSPSAEPSSSYAPLELHEHDDDSFMDPDPASRSLSPTLSTTINMSAEMLDSRMDVELPALSAQKRPSSPSSPSSTRMFKKLRKSDFTVADQVMHALSSNSSMRSDVLNILGLLLSVQSQAQPEDNTTSLRWIEPVMIAADAVPPQLQALDFTSPVAVAVFTQSPAEHWSFVILNKAGQTIQLRLHDCQVLDERSDLIKQRFGEWMDVVANHATVELISETCPRLLGCNWSSGLHVLSCLRRALAHESCSTVIPFVPAIEQNKYLELINRGSYASDALAPDDQYLLDAVQSRIHDRKLASKPMDVLDQERAKMQEELREAEIRFATKDQSIETMMRELVLQREGFRNEILKVRARAEQFERVYQRKLTLVAKQEKEAAKAQADQNLRELQEKLAQATAAKEQRQAELEEAADQHDDNMVGTDDWKRDLTGAMGELFGDEGRGD
ncbi:hypothetical protein HG530_014534 [Fusarium avenaceum]|nr:hypothetical protein HG530_014534 [Fusarium avenaceum]